MLDRKCTYHGVSISILMLDAPSSAFNGDIGNARTGPFSMQYRIACDATPNRVTRPDGFDMVTLVHWFHRGLSPERFTQD